MTPQLSLEPFWADTPFLSPLAQLAQHGTDALPCYVHPGYYKDLISVYGPRYALKDTFDCHLEAVAASRSVLFCNDSLEFLSTKVLLSNDLQLAQALKDRILNHFEIFKTNGTKDDPTLTSDFEIEHLFYGTTRVQYSPGRGLDCSHFAFRSDRFDWDTKYRSCFVRNLDASESLHLSAHLVLNSVYNEKNPTKKRGLK